MSNRSTHGDFWAGTVGLLISLHVALTALGQHPFSAFRAVNNCDRLAVLPNWKFFAPNPSSHDFHLAFRVRYQDTAESEWHVVHTPRTRGFWKLIWLPERRLGKSLHDLCSEIMVIHQSEASFVQESSAYKILSGQVAQESADVEGEVAGLQFAIMQGAGYDSGEQPELIYASPFIGMGSQRINIKGAEG